MFYSLANNPIVGNSLEVVENGAVGFKMKLDCPANTRLRVDAVDNLTVEARIEGSGDWTNLETGSLDLDPYAGTTETFEFRVSAAAVSGFRVQNVAFRITA